jgi:hypothetical protein
MTKVEKLNDLISKIRYQLPIGVTTMGLCVNHCGNSARGSGVCVNCLELELADLVGRSNALDYVCAAIVERFYRAKMFEILEKDKS